MCGIGGYISFGKKRPNKEQVKNMFTLLESRGTDASGWAYKQDDKLIVVKAPMKASLLVDHKNVWNKLRLPKTMIFHTRAATQGDENINSNNHPLFDSDTAIVHNGIIWNYYSWGIPKTVVDSLAILKAMEEAENNLDKVFNLLDGSYAVASVNKNDDNLLLFRHGSPIEGFYDSRDEIFYFASTADILMEAYDIKSDYVRGFEVASKRWNYVDFPDDSSMLIGPEGLLQTAKHKSKYSYSRYSGYNYREDWEDYQYGDNYKYGGKSSSYDKDEKKEAPKLEAPKIEDVKENSWEIVNCPQCGERTPYDVNKLSDICCHCKSEMLLDDILEQF